MPHPGKESEAGRWEYETYVPLSDLERVEEDRDRYERVGKEFAEMWRGRAEQAEEECERRSEELSDLEDKCDAHWGRAEKAEQEVERLKDELGECYRLSGADPDGDSNAHLAQDAVQACREGREEWDECAEELAQAEAENERLREALEEITRVKNSPPDAEGIQPIDGRRKAIAIARKALSPQDKGDG